MKILAVVSIVFVYLSLLSFGTAWGQSCVTATCHPDSAGLTQLHAPMKHGDCFSCHVQRSDVHPAKPGKTFELAAGGGALCKTCHRGIFKKKKFAHAPVKDRNCFACHNPHLVGVSFMLKSDEDLNALCQKCHDSAPFKVKFMHGPAAVGSCTECHDPHGSKNKKLLRGSVRKLCLNCHADFASAMKGAAVVHRPVQKGPCTACHNPHGSAVVMFLNKKTPDLCAGCHKPIEKKVEAKVPHKPIMQDGGCGNCHVSHFSKFNGILALDEMSTCLSCHGTDTLGKPALHNIKKELEGKQFLHGPIKKGQCKVCHDPHGSEHFRMLSGGYPDTVYKPYKEGEYDICLKCHEKNLLLSADTTSYTKFRNGNRNLHYVHVSNRRKGRSCRVCHAPHASNGEKLINVEGATFGDWKIPINFKSTATGGSCAPGCHRDFSYDREKPQSYDPEVIYPEGASSAAPAGEKNKE